MRWKIECTQCRKKGSFDDVHDISQAKWKIIAWDVNNSEPKCLCDECQEKQPTKKKK